MASIVYLVHYQRPRKHHRHAVRCVKASAALIKKLHRHLDGHAIDPLATRDGILFVLVQTWNGRGEPFERKLKRQKHHSRLCPVCNPNAFARRTRRMT